MTNSNRLSTPKQAIDITKQLQELIAKGGFQLTKVISNYREVLLDFPKGGASTHSENNPADYASRGIKTWETEKLERWRRGVEFLWKDESEWPTAPRPRDRTLRRGRRRQEREGCSKHGGY